MPQAHITGTQVFAFSLEDLPDRDDFYLAEPSWEYDLSLLKACQIPVRDVSELGDWVLETGLPQVPVIFCEMQNVKGEVDTDDLIPWRLIFLNTGLHTSVNDLRESYLHELAHFNDNNNSHGLQFSSVNNLYRLHAGFGISDEDWDYNACENEDRTIDEAKSLASTIAHYLFGQKVPIGKAVETIEWLATTGCDRQWDTEGVVKALELILSPDGHLKFLHLWPPIFPHLGVAKS